MSNTWWFKYMDSVNSPRRLSASSSESTPTTRPRTPSPVIKKKRRTNAGTSRNLAKEFNNAMQPMPTTSIDGTHPVDRDNLGPWAQNLAADVLVSLSNENTQTEIVDVIRCRTRDIYNPAHDNMEPIRSESNQSSSESSSEDQYKANAIPTIEQPQVQQLIQEVRKGFEAEFAQFKLEIQKEIEDKFEARLRVALAGKLDGKKNQPCTSSSSSSTSIIGPQNPPMNLGVGNQSTVNQSNITELFPSTSQTRRRRRWSDENDVQFVTFVDPPKWMQKIRSIGDVKKEPPADNEPPIVETVEEQDEQLKEPKREIEEDQQNNNDIGQQEQQNNQRQNGIGNDGTQMAQNANGVGIGNAGHDFAERVTRGQQAHYNLRGNVGGAAPRAPQPLGSWLLRERKQGIYNNNGHLPPFYYMPEPTTGRRSAH